MYLQYRRVVVRDLEVVLKYQFLYGVLISRSWTRASSLYTYMV